MAPEYIYITRASDDSKIIIITAVSKYLFSMSRNVFKRKAAQPIPKGVSSTANIGMRS